tara:strand:- start:5661 stop:6839 length:1179 start_codon:yes stop_codon:yes gene_type:complete
MFMKRLFCLFVLLLSVSSSHGLLNDLIIVKNHTRPGYDDNVFTRTSGNETGSFYVEQIVSIDAILSANQRHMLSTMYSPKYVYRDLDQKQLLYHTWVTKMQYKPTPKSTFDISHKWTTSEREPTDIDADVDITWAQTQTDLQFSHTFSRRSSTVIGLSRKTKEWSENLLAVGEMYTDGDFEQYSANVHQIYELIKGRLFWTTGVEATRHEYVNDRGGFHGGDLYNNIIYVLGKSTILQLDCWYGHSTTVLQEDETDGGGWGPSWKASLNSQLAQNLMTGLSFTYETVDSSIAFWNAKDIYKAMINVKYNITPKLETMSAVVLSESSYLEDYDRNGTGLTRKDYLGVVIWNTTYNINRNHAVELNFMGFAMNPHKELEGVARNKLTLGYKLTL